MRRSTAEGARAHLDLSEANAPPILVRGQVLLNQDEVDAVKVRSQDQKKIARPVAESSRKRPGVGDGHAGKLEQIDLEETLIVGDELDLSDSPNETFGGYSEITGRLNRAAVGVVAKPAEKRGGGVRVAENLNVLRAYVEVVLMLDGALPPRELASELSAKAH